MYQAGKAIISCTEIISQSITIIVAYGCGCAVAWACACVVWLPLSGFQLIFCTTEHRLPPIGILSSSHSAKAGDGDGDDDGKFDVLFFFRGSLAF